MNNEISAEGGSAQGRKKIIAEQFDVLVIGGGPAGLMAAGRAAEKGARVALVEKNDRYGVKLLMTGNGRCNITQEIDDMLDFSRAYGRNGKFLLSSLEAFRPKMMREFLRKKGIGTKVEKNGKVFPNSDQSKDVVEALYEYCRENMVTFFSSEEVTGIEFSENRIIRIITKKKEISAEKYILAVGGKSYPHTGSSGDGYKWAEKLGHTVRSPFPKLVPIKVKEEWIASTQGVSARNVVMKALKGGKEIARESGDIMFAHFGISGPAALNISRHIPATLDGQDVQISLDLKPELTSQQLDEIIRKDFEANGGKKWGNCFTDFASPKLLDLIINLSGIDPELHASRISKSDRCKIVNLFKDMRLTVSGLFGFEKAMITGGGVDIKEINPKTMKSRMIDNLYFAGEIIDVDGPTGGYNLQICWSTGFVAGENAAAE